MGNYDTGQELKDILGANFNVLDSTDKAIVENIVAWDVAWDKAAADSMATDATTALVVGAARRRAKVKRVFYMPDAALTAHASNFATLTVQKLTAAGGSATTVASITTEVTGSGSWTARVAVPLTLSTTAGSTVLEDLAALTFGIAKAASGVVVPKGRLVIVLEPAGADDSTS